MPKKDPFGFWRLGSAPDSCLLLLYTIIIFIRPQF